MRNLLFIFGVILITSLQGAARNEAPADSVGIETINGKIYVIHEVEEGETLYAIAARYGASMNAIARVSPEVKSGLHSGMRILVPYKPKAKTPDSVFVHTVKQGETLYSISRLYKVSYQQIMKWNAMPSTDIEVGQQLTIGGEEKPKPEDIKRDGLLVHVVQPGEGLFAVSRLHRVSLDSLVAWNHLESTALSVGQELIVGPIPVIDETEIIHPPRVEEDTVMTPQPVREMHKIIKSGLAAMIEGTGDNGTYLGLHRTAPTGTIVMVKNEMNDQAVFVRIVGKLPDTGVNDKVIIRLSEAAYKTIGAIDPKVRVVVSYFGE